MVSRLMHLMIIDLLAPCVALRLGAKLQPLAVAKLLKALVDKEQPGLIILGKQALCVISVPLEGPEYRSVRKLAVPPRYSATVLARGFDVTSITLVPSRALPV